jgi:putative SOS response-associated peptidase YedK
MEWGLIPFWSKKGKGLINARAETVSSKPSFKRAFRSKRCLVPASSFFEWQQTSEGKVPFLIKLKDQELFALAGLYEEWTNAEGEPIKTYAILTCGPNTLMAPIHNRMPVILTPRAEGTWLNPAAELPALRQLLKPYAASQMEAYLVSRDVNSPANEGPSL